MTTNERNVLYISPSKLQRILSRLPQLRPILTDEGLLPAPAGPERAPYGSYPRRRSGPTGGSGGGAPYGSYAQRRSGPTGNPGGPRHRLSPTAHRAVGGTLRQLSRSARHVGCRQDSGSGRRYCFFRANADGHGFDMLARPLRARRFVVISIRPSQGELQGEFEIVRNIQGTIQWTGPMTIAAAARNPGGGIYIIEKNNTPIYVGKATQFSGRWRTRAEYIRQMGVDPNPYRVWLGRVTLTDTTGVALNRDNMFGAAEHLVVRALANRGGTLTNITPKNPFTVGQGFNVRNIGGPSYLSPVINPRQGSKYELGGEMAGEMVAGELGEFSGEMNELGEMYEMQELGGSHELEFGELNELSGELSAEGIF